MNKRGSKLKNLIPYEKDMMNMRYIGLAEEKGREKEGNRKETY